MISNAAQARSRLSDLQAIKNGPSGENKQTQGYIQYSDSLSMPYRAWPIIYVRSFFLMSCATCGQVTTDGSWKDSSSEDGKTDQRFATTDINLHSVMAIIMQLFSHPTSISSSVDSPYWAFARPWRITAQSSSEDFSSLTDLNLWNKLGTFPLHKNFVCGSSGPASKMSWPQPLLSDPMPSPCHFGIHTLGRKILFMWVRWYCWSKTFSAFCLSLNSPMARYITRLSSIFTTIFPEYSQLKVVVPQPNN